MASRVAEAAAATGKPAILAFLGLDHPPQLPMRVRFARSLEAAATWAAQTPAAEGMPQQPHSPPGGALGAIRGCSGRDPLLRDDGGGGRGRGTGRLNIPLRPEWRLADPHRSEGHTFVDFGDDAMTEEGPIR